MPIIAANTVADPKAIHLSGIRLTTLLPGRRRGRKHGGLTVSENLAYACALCNGNKGSDIGTILQDEDVFVRLYHPRKHKWFEYFEVMEGALYPLSDLASATIKVLDLNNINRILERLDLIEAGLFP